MGSVNVTGSITMGPGLAGSGFPSVAGNAKFGLSQDQKSAPCCTGTIVRNLGSNVYIELDGIGAGHTVTHCDTLYFRTNGPITLRLTFGDGAGGQATPVEIPVAGLYLAEFQSSRELELLEAKGSGTIEYLASGQT